MTPDQRAAALRLADALDNDSASYAALYGPDHRPSAEAAALLRALAAEPDDYATDSAVRTMARLGYTYHGGEMWKPPLKEGVSMDGKPAEPVAWMRSDGLKAMPDDERTGWLGAGVPSLVEQYTIPLYTHPPQREPLSDEEIEKMLMDWPVDGIAFIDFARAIERHHGIGGKP